MKLLILGIVVLLGLAADGSRRPPLPATHQIEVRRIIEEIEPYASGRNTAIEIAMAKAMMEKREVERFLEVKVSRPL